MELPVVLQATQFALSVVLGACLGVLYDFFRALRRLCTWLTIPLDILFVVLLLPSLLLFALYAGRGQLRLFMLAGCLAGGTIYFLSLSFVVNFAFERFFKLFFTSFSWIYRKILSLFRIFRKKRKKNVAIVKKNSNIDNKRNVRRHRAVAHNKARKRGAVVIENSHKISQS